MQVRHCLDVHGTALSDGGDTGSATPSGAGVAAYALDRRKVCLHFARKLLQQGPPGGSSATGSRWLRPQLLEAWAAAVPEEWSPPEPGLLAGEALEELPEGAVQGELSLRSRHGDFVPLYAGKIATPIHPPPASRRARRLRAYRGAICGQGSAVGAGCTLCSTVCPPTSLAKARAWACGLLVLQGPLATVLLGCRRGAQRSAAPLPTQY